MGLRARLSAAQTKQAHRRETPTLRRTIAAIAPKGMLIVYDRGGNDAETLNCFVRRGLRFITRLNANAALYDDPQCRQKINPWCYQQKYKRNEQTVYRHEMLCYRKKVRSQLKVVIEIFYNRSRRTWRAIYYVSTDTSLSADEIVNVYRTRCRIEGVHADSKLQCGFNSCRVHSAKAIEGYLCLSILASGILEYVRYQMRHLGEAAGRLSTLEILQTLGMHWYRPMGLTRGLTARYLEHLIRSGAEALPTSRTAFSRQPPPSP